MFGSSEWASASERGGHPGSGRISGVIAPEIQKRDFHKPGKGVNGFYVEAQSGSGVLEENPLPLCAGHGDLEGISLTDWEAGLGSWTVDTRGIANPATFDTPDWNTVGNLPDNRPGTAAFVANLDIGDCAEDDETGALTLDSPSIQIPAGALVPRIAVDHWFATEFGYDGGNLKISVNGGAFSLIPKSAFEFNLYNNTLITALDGNSNPLAGEDAFTGADGGQQTGSWRQSRISLYGIAAAGDTIQLRFDFGVDACSGLVGWYVDQVEVYSCSDELPPSDCGNGMIDPDEQCDDGNTFIGDGCSNSCQVEAGWECSDPSPPGEVPDGSFEAGTPNPSWSEASTNFGSPICDETDCGIGIGTGPADGVFWAWFGGVVSYEEASLSQSLEIPSTSNELQFELEVSRCDSPSDYLEVLIDGNQAYLVDGTSSLCGALGYTTQSVDVSAWADDDFHDVEFHSESFANNADFSNFYVDAVSLPGIPSICSEYTPSLMLVKNVINDDGGTAAASDWILTASGPSGFSGNGPSVSSEAGFAAGSYDLSESGGPLGYIASDWVCAGGTQIDGDTIMLSADDIVTCTITNDDEAATSLTLVKEVINDNGGNAKPSDWNLIASGPTPLSGNGPSVTSGTGFADGSYDLSESGGPAGYGAGDWVCVGGSQDDADTITLAPGDVATCTIINDDISPTLKVVKNIVNDNGGTVTDGNAFGLRVDGEAVMHNATNEFDVGDHTVSEDGLPGYQPGTWGGDCNPDGTITLALGQEATCSIINDDIDPDFQINAGHSGAWYYPETAGQGLFIDVEPAGQFMFISWFTYTDAASANPFEQRWFTAQGNYSGKTAELILNETLGGKFDDPQEATTLPVGVVTLLFDDCEQGLMSYSFDTEDLQGEFPLVRVIPGSGNVCAGLSTNNTQVVDINAGMDGAWFDPLTSGQGFFIDAHPDPEGGDFIFVSWFTYGDDTVSGQRWLTAQGGFEGSTAEIEVNETTGGSFDDPQPPDTVAVGTMSLDFTDCSNAQLSYSLPADGAAGDIDITRVVPGGQALCEQLAGME